MVVVWHETVGMNMYKAVTIKSSMSSGEDIVRRWTFIVEYVQVVYESHAVLIVHYDRAFLHPAIE